MPVTRFSWDNIDSQILRNLSNRVNADTVQPAQAMAGRFGVRPKEDFVKECWPALLEAWLKHDNQSLHVIASDLRKIQLGDTGVVDDFQYLQSCRNAKRLREVVLREFIRLGKTMSSPQSLTGHPTVLDSNIFPTPRRVTTEPLIISRDSAESEGITPWKDGPSPELPIDPTCVAGQPSPNKRRLTVLAGSVLAVATLGFASLLYSNFEYQRTVALGESRHISRLLNLSEDSGTATQSLAQIALFRKGNWRNYLSRRSLNALNMKSNALHRAMEVASLRNFAIRNSAVPLTEANADQIYETYSKVRASSAFQYLDPSLQEFASTRTARAQEIQQKVIARQQELERKAKEAAELAAKMKKEEEQRQAEAAARARQADEAQATGSFGADNGYQLGPRGGCFYWSGSSKIYVDRSNCL